MISLTLIKRECRSNYKILLIFMAVLAIYSSVIIAMFDPKLGKSMKAMAESMPQVFAAFGMLNAASTMIEFLANYLYGFLLIVFPSVFIILTANRLVARYTDRGSMAYLLATPNKRTKIILTQAVFLSAGIFLLVAFVTVLCMVVSGAMFPGELAVNKFLLLNTGLFGLLLFIGGVCFCASCIFNDTRLSYGVGSGLIIAFILVQMLSQAGEKFEDLKYATPLTLFQPDRLIAGKENAVWLFLVLYGVGILLFGAGIFIFKKRDLPV